MKKLVLIIIAVLTVWTGANAQHHKLVDDKYGYIFYCHGDKGTFYDKKIPHPWNDDKGQKNYVVCVAVIPPMYDGAAPRFIAYIYRQDAETGQYQQVYKMQKDVQKTLIYENSEDPSFGLRYMFGNGECVWFVSNIDCMDYFTKQKPIPDSLEKRAYDIAKEYPVIDLRFEQDFQFYAYIDVIATNKGNNTPDEFVVSWFDVLDYLYTPVKDTVK